MFSQRNNPYCELLQKEKKLQKEKEAFRRKVVWLKK
jgi:hypothetical protein